MERHPTDDREWNPEGGTEQTAPVDEREFDFRQFAAQPPAPVYWDCPQGDYRVPGTVDGPFGDGICASHPNEILIRGA